MIKKSPSLGAFYERVLNGQKNRKKNAIVAVARKLLSIMRAMQMTGELFNEKLIDKLRIMLIEDAVSGLYPKGKEEMLNVGVHVVNAKAVEKER